MFARTLTLLEYEPLLVAAEALPDGVGAWLWQTYDQQQGVLRVEFPTLATGGQWRLTSLGWVGSLPVGPDLLLELAPKVSLQNLFAMWRYVYDLPSAHWLAGLTLAESLDDFFAQLALILAQGVLQRARLGLHQAYLVAERPLPVLRGQIRWRLLPRPGDVQLPCRYDLLTADIWENQVLAVTLDQIARSGRCPDDVQQVVARTARLLRGVVARDAPLPEEWWERPYTRLTADYQPLHAVCRFFLDHASPTHQVGARRMMPFLVNMAQLYQRFVAAWLAVHLPAPWRVRVQENVRLSGEGDMAVDIDLVLYDGENRPRMVLDTKYKAPEKAVAPDFHQVVAYAAVKEVAAAALVYPVELQRPLDVSLGELRVRSLTFALDGPLELCGQKFLQQLLTWLAATSAPRLRKGLS